MISKTNRVDATVPSVKAEFGELVINGRQVTVGGEVVPCKVVNVTLQLVTVNGREQWRVRGIAS